MYRPRISRVLCLLCLLICVQAVKSQSKLDSIQSLQEVVITQRISKEIIPTQSLSGKELEKLGAFSVADALRYFAGVQIKDYGGVGGLKTVNVRSMGSEHVGVFFDGVEIGNAQNGVVDLGRFSLENMEVISLYNGQKSSIFQSAKDFSSASALYMQTRDPKFRGDKKYNTFFTFKTGAFGLVNPSILWEQKVTSNISSSLNIAYTYSNGKYQFRTKVVNNDDNRGGYDTTQIRKNGEIQYFRIEHALFGRIENGEWKTKLYYYDSDRGIPGATVRKEPGRFQNEDKQWDRNFFVQSSLKKKISEIYSTQFLAKFDYNNLRYQSDPDKDEQVVLKVDNKYYQQEIYASSANYFNILPFWSANLSVDYQWNKLNANVRSFSYPKRHQAWANAATSVYFDRLKMQANLLMFYANERFTENTYDPETGLYPGQEEVKKTWERYTPSVIISYQPMPDHNLNFRAFYKKVFRLPTFNETYYSILGGLKSTLRPEYTTQYNIGTTYSKDFDKSIFKSIEGQVDVYYNRVVDKIVRIPGVNLSVFSVKNIGLVKIKGVDLSARLTTSPAKDLVISGRATYTYQKAQDYTDPEDTYNYKGQISYIPRHSGSAILAGEYKNWGLNYSFIYTGERYSVSANTPDNYVLAWYTHDLGLSYNFKWRGNKYSITAEVNNLFNQQYEVVRRFPMPGTNFKFILRANF